MAGAPRSQIRPRDINASVGGIRFDKGIVAIGWEFKPSIGIVARDVDNLGLAITSMKEPLTRAVKNVMIPSVRQNFQVGGRPPWEPLAPYTVQERGGSAWPILQRTGALKKAATSFKIWTITDSAATVRNLPDDVWYGKLHQEGIGGFGSYIAAAKKALGAKASPRDITAEAFHMLDQAKGVGGHHKVAIPARPFIMFQDDDEDAIQEVFADWLQELAVKVGRFSR